MLWFRVPQKVYIKKGCLPVALDELKHIYNKKKVCIVTDSFLYKNGYTKAVTHKLDELGITHTTFYNVAPDPSLASAKEGAQLLNSFEPDAIVAIGGGSAMDAAKIMWVLYEHPEVDFLDMAMGENTNRSEPFFDEDVDLVKLQFTDIFGQCKMVQMTRGQAEKAMKEGYAINRFALGGLQKAGIEGAAAPEYLTDQSESVELYLKPDASTYQVLPWDSGQENVARVICQVCNADGTPSWTDSRHILQETVKRAEKMGLDFDFDFQCEFYLFHTDDDGRPTTVTHEVAGYYDAGPIDLAEGVRRDMVLSLEEAGFAIESTHHGLTAGQHSFVLPARRGIEAADYLQTFKAAVKRIAKRHGLHATFMPKPNMSGDGSGLHVGVSISSRRGAEAMAQAKQFAAGVLKNLSDMMIFTNPTVNSYKRLAAERSTVFQPEFPAAVWEKGSEKAVHVKEDRNGRISVEVQFPDPSANPYLALTAILAAGLEGIEKALVLDEEAGDEDAPRFPETLGILLQKLDQNEFAHRVFGEKFCRMYGEGKKEEWERFCAYVTDWETAEYLYRC